MKKNHPVDCINKPGILWEGEPMVKEFIDASGIHEKIQSLPFHKSGNVIVLEHWEIAKSFIVDVILSAGNCAGSTQMWDDSVIKELFQWKRGMPSHCTSSRFSSKCEQNHTDKLFNELEDWLFRLLPDDKIAIDFDGIVRTLYEECEGSDVGYNPTKRNRKLHHPFIAFPAEKRRVINSWLRAGVNAVSMGFDIFPEETITFSPANKIGLKRVDNGFSGNKIQSGPEDRRLQYIISLTLRDELFEEILSINQWLRCSTKGVSCSNFVYSLNSLDQGRPVVLIRKDIERLSISAGKPLFSAEDNYLRYSYAACVTCDSKSAELIWHDNNQRSTAENQIKELKYDCALEGFCLLERLTTAFAFKWVTTVYTITSYFRNTIGAGEIQPALSTLKYQYVTVGAYLTSSSKTKGLMPAAQSTKRSKLEIYFKKHPTSPANFKLQLKNEC